MVVGQAIFQLHTYLCRLPMPRKATSDPWKKHMKHLIRWLAIVLVAAPATCLAATTSEACMANSKASLDAMVHADNVAAGKGFSAATAKALPPKKIGQTWAEVQQMFGTYRSHGAPRRQIFQGKPVVVTRVTFANGPLDFVVGRDASNQITMFYLLKPSVVEAPARIEARTEAGGTRVEPLAVPSPDGPLRGALTLPAGLGPFPAVVLVQGSGAHDLDETIGPNKPFRDIAEGLARAGIASLRYDKRTFDYGLKAAANPDFTIDDEVTDDALTALRLLAKQKQVDPRRVFVLGHSLGAQMAPRIAARDPKLAGAIMLAAPAQPLLDVFAEQIREGEERAGKTKAQIAKAGQPIVAEQALLAKADLQHPPKGMSYAIPGAPVPQVYQLSLYDYHQVAVAQSLSLPMLILQGGDDFQVSPKSDFDTWKTSLAGKSNVTFHLFPGLSHLFMPGPARSPADYAKPTHVDPAVIREIANWIKAQPAK